MRRDIAMGTMTLHLMPLASPSMANTFAKPTRPILAELKGYSLGATCSTKWILLTEKHVAAPMVIYLNLSHSELQSGN